MNRSAVFSLALLFGSSFAFSQGSIQQMPAGTFTSLYGAGCPVSLVAQRGPGAVVQTKGPSREAAQRLELHWKNLRDKDMVAATVQVWGYDATPRVLPVGYATPSPMKKNFDLVVNIEGHGRSTTGLTARSFATVKWIDLKSIAYADGTHWNVSKGEMCRISPNGFLRVGAAEAR